MDPPTVITLLQHRRKLIAGHIHGFLDRSFLLLKSWSTRVHGAENLRCKATVHFMPVKVFADPGRPEFSGAWIMEVDHELYHTGFIVKKCGSSVITGQP